MSGSLSWPDDPRSPGLKCIVRAPTQRSKNVPCPGPEASGTAGRYPRVTESRFSYCVMYFTGRLIISHPPVPLSYLQLHNASQFSLSMLGLSALK